MLNFLSKEMNKPISTFCAPYMVSMFAFTEMIYCVDFQNGCSEKILVSLAVC